MKLVREDSDVDKFMVDQYIIREAKASIRKSAKVPLTENIQLTTSVASLFKEKLKPLKKVLFKEIPF